MCDAATEIVCPLAAENAAPSLSVPTSRDARILGRVWRNTEATSGGLPFRSRSLPR